jgi:predicted nucleic acid-binding protein
MIICDSNIFIEVFRKNLFIRSKLENIGCENVVISDIIKAELFFVSKNKQ